MMPLANTTPPPTMNTTPASKSRPSFAVLIGSADIGHSGQTGSGKSNAGKSGAGRMDRGGWHRLGLLVVAGVHETEQARHQKQRGAGGEDQATDHRAAQRRVLSGPDSHPHHADEHCE